MARIKLILACLAAVVLTYAAYPQTGDSTRVKLNHYSLAIGTGWTHYINNFDYGDKNMKQDFVGFSGRFFWEPEYRLSLGLETGYYKLFRTGYQYGDTSANADRTVVPLLLLVRMRVAGNFHVGAGMGLAFLTNKVTGIGNKVVAKKTSLSNFELSGSYIHPVSKLFRVGGEVKVFHFAALSDWMYSVQAFVAIRF